MFLGLSCLKWGSPRILKERLILIYFIIAALIVMIDQLAKYLITTQLTFGEQIPLIPGVIHLTYIRNTGAAFSFMADMRWVLVVVSAVVIVLLIGGMIRYRDKISLVGMLALTAVLGGAFSHLFDRAVFGYVVDFFEFEFVNFAIFDVADCFITVGGILFCIYYLFKRDEINNEPRGSKRSSKVLDVEKPEIFGDDSPTEKNPEDDSDTN